MKKILSKKWMLVMMMFFLCMMAAAPAQQVQAASNKSKALKAYRKMLSKKTLKRDEYTIYNTKNCRFAVAYIDNNSIPELIVYNSTDASHIQGFGALYTYRKGKVQLVAPLALDTRSRLGYYKKTGWFFDNTTYQGYGGDTFYKLKSGKLQNDFIYGRSTEFDGRKYQVTGYSMSAGGQYLEMTATQFNRAITYQTKGKKLTKFKFYKNTKKNRSKYLK